MRVKQSGHIGDLIYSLSSIKRVAELSGEGVDLFIGFNEINRTPEHPSGNYTMNDNYYRYLLPLLKELPYINSVTPAKKEVEVDYNFDSFRNNGYNLGAYDLRRWHGLIYEDLSHPNIMTAKCIEIESKLPYLKGKIAINLSLRYRNPTIDYSKLKDIEHDLIFVGLDNEYNDFILRYNVIPKRVNVKDALHMATILNSVDLFIGNQSSTFALAEQMKIKRALDVYNPSPNVIVSGDNGYDFMTTKGMINAITELTK
jgi:hypothetical protein